MAIKEMRILSLIGSSHQNGNTSLVTKRFAEISGSHVVDLGQKDISYYDYGHKNFEDDFLPLIKDFLQNYDTLVLVTPIYWYTMSAEVKTFLDRISDLLTIEKDLGRQLRGKSMALISQTEGDFYHEWFAEPIRLTAKYLGMEFKGHVHVSIEKKGISKSYKKKLEAFAKLLAL
ncbi:NADPH-dependent FMN reductase [Reichenbachiella faecimaris]|uniref:NADPH-dependent FMN reductase n=1 Tax=Reichenbachiella faecimaris TaxID=692418 RepID=A0A1W2GQR0_REIFA|nr:NAD(P)H-dependent oxidoreductase [Reichenbachiella faecimaris]SMD38951.1 NADPH-dependent FMN reductase [Reichenbachiella faecimaris]